MHKFCATVILFFMLAGMKPNYAKAADSPDTVKVGLYVVSVHDIDFHNNAYTVRFWLWFVYNQPKPGEKSKFDFPNQIDIPNAKEIDDPLVVTDTIDGKIWVQMLMKCLMKENWKVDNFPFDQQHLKIVLENTVYTNQDLVFKADAFDSGFDSVEVLNSWKLRDYKVSAGTTLYHTGFGEPRTENTNSNTFSNFVFEMNIERNAIGLFMKIFNGMYIAFLIAVLSFFVDPGETEPRFGLPVGSLFAAVGNKYIIDSLLPESSKFNLVDTLHTITFVGIFFILAISAIALKLHSREEVVRAHRVNRIGLIAVVSLYVIANIYFVLVA